MRLPDRLLFVGAHCDDVELFAGGLLAHVCRVGLPRIGVMVLSDHRGVIDDSAASLAMAEMEQNLAWLETRTGCTIVRYVDLMLPACTGAFQSERSAIYAALEAVRGDYDLVVTHSPHDTNQDHQQVAWEVMRVFKAHATVLGGEFPNNDLGDAKAAVYVTLEQQDVDAKVHMIRSYRSQAFGGRPYLDETLIRALARVRGSQIRELQAEAFELVTRAILRG